MLHVSGDDQEKATEALKALFENGFGELVNEGASHRILSNPVRLIYSELVYHHRAQSLVRVNS